jgi:peptide/nickel transport system substrate-binding protein
MEGGQAMSDAPDFRIGRRDLLASAAVGAGAIALGACGGDSKSTANTTSGSPATGTDKPKRGGTLRFGPSDGSSSSDTIDTLNSGDTLVGIAMGQALYDTLITFDEDGKLTPRLAEEYEPADDVRSWTVRLRDAEFHNGKPVTADDVIYSLRRVLDPKAGGSAATFLAAVDPKRLEKMDDRTVRIHLKYPDVSLPYGLRLQGAAIVPVDFDPKHPIGSGPFKLKSFNPGQQSAFVRNDNFWQSGKPYLDELQVVDFADPGTTRINALTSGQIDFVNRVPFNMVPQLEGRPDQNVLISKSYNYATWEMRMDKAPFDDVRVRQALMLLVDRDQVVEQAYSGSKFATVANDLSSRQDPLFNDSLPQRQQDIEQAKSLLKAAGRDGLTVELVVADVQTGLVQTAEVWAEQAKAAGVTIKVKKVNSSEYFEKYWHQAPFKFDYWSTNPYWEFIGYALLPGAAYNISSWKDPQWVDLVTEARGTLDEAKRKELAGEAQKIQWERGTQGVFAYFFGADAHSKKFKGFEPSVLGYANGVRFEDVSVA